MIMSDSSSSVCSLLSLSSISEVSSSSDEGKILGEWNKVNNWRPPFSVNPQKFGFTPRLQKLNELEAQTRIRLNFHDQLGRFWELQGIKLRIPNVDRKLLDLFKLNKHVLSEGGFDAVCNQKKWCLIAKMLNVGSSNNSVASTLKTHYEKILLPFDLFISGASFQHLKSSFLKKKGKVKPAVSENENGSSGGRMLKANLGPPSLKKVPKRGKTGRTRKIDQYVCLVCKGGDHEEKMLLCDGCDDPYHIFCLTPKLSDVPMGDWICPRCLASVYYRPPVDFGFQQSNQEYTLDTFGEMADKFKCEFFNKPIGSVSRESVEYSFWQLVTSLRGNVWVEYGADLSAGEVGSGFPTKKNTKVVTEELEKYISSGWNLNNLPVNEKSVLRHIDVDISGMKIPWCYVGMCFSSFCWHIEDHWSYSINYLHRGEPKTWYGVGSGEADLFEQVMRDEAPELFEQSPDLLHHITTIMNPNVLMERGVNICRTDQQAGEFVITFPRAYHAGFNQGFNFAEAVNFCPVDWLGFGRDCIKQYADMHRRCVFSHDELVCLMAARCEDLDPSLLEGIQLELEKIQANEKMQRKIVLKNGIRRTDRVVFEDLPDDDRQCILCSTTMFLSALMCPCSPTKLVCLSHTERICNCTIENKVLHYRHTLDELNDLVRNIKSKLDDYSIWKSRVEIILGRSKLEDFGSCNKPTYEELQDLIAVGELKQYPSNDLMGLNKLLTDMRRCSRLCQELFQSDNRRKTRGYDHTLEVKKLTLAEFHEFSQYVRQLPCEIEELAHLLEVDEKIVHWKEAVEVQVSRKEPDREKLKSLLQFADDLDVTLPQCPDLRQLLEHVEWLESVKKTLSDPEDVSLSDLTSMLEIGCLLSQEDERVVETCNRLKRILHTGENIEAKALSILKARTGQYAMFAVQSVVNEASVIEVYLPHVEKLEDMLVEAKQITKELDEIKHLMNQKIYPIRETVVSLLDRSQKLPISFPGIKELQSSLSYLENWREHAASIFLKKNSPHSLLEVLLPRSVAAINQLADRYAGILGTAAATSTGSKSTAADTSTVASSSGGAKRVRKASAAAKLAHLSASRENCQIYEQKWKEQSLMSEKVCSEVYRKMETDEITAISRLRHANTRKSEGGNQAEATYCHCDRAGLKGIMVQCELCRDWFHEQCVTLPKRENIREAKFLCPQCERSLRPTLSTAVFDLMRKICFDVTIRFPEVDALQLLTNRALTYQHRVHRLISRDKELRRAFSDYSRIMEVRLTGPGEQWTKPPSSFDSRFKDFNDPSHFNKKQSRKSPHNLRGVAPGNDSSSFPGHSGHRQLSKHSHDPGQSSGSSLSGREERTSTSGNQGGGSTTGSKDISKKLQNVHFDLSNQLRADLVLLIMEGDLLEVTIPETTWLWHIYQCSAPQSGAKAAAAREKRNSRGRSNVKDAMFPHSRSRSRSSHVSSIDGKSFASHNKGSSAMNPISRGHQSKLFRRQHRSRSSSFSCSSSTSSSGGQSSGDLSDSINSLSERGGHHHHHTHHQPESDSDSDLSSNSKNSSFCMDTQSLPSSKPPAKRPVVPTTTKRPKAVNSWTLGSEKPVKTGPPPVKQQPSALSTTKYPSKTSNKKIVTLRKVKKSPTPASVKKGSSTSGGTTVKTKARESSVSEAAPVKKRTRVCNDDCHADVCCQPAGNKVNWVMCDTCSFWYHWSCVGIQSDGQISDDYMCPQCLQKNDTITVKDDEEMAVTEAPSSGDDFEAKAVKKEDESFTSLASTEEIVPKTWASKEYTIEEATVDSSPQTASLQGERPCAKAAPQTDPEEPDYGEPPVLEQQEEGEEESTPEASIPASHS